MSTNLIVGTGKLGKKLYHFLNDKDATVFTLSRSAKPWSKNHLQQDLLADNFVLPKLPELDRVFIVIAPSERTESAYRKTYVDAVSRAIKSLHKTQSDFHCTFLSATSVFGSEQLGVVNEQTVPKPDNFRGEILLEAEENIKQLCQSHSIVRASGLYSSDRQRLIDSILSKEQLDNPKWLNLIHDDDLCHWLDMASSKKWSLSIASDGSPFQRKQIQLDIQPVIDQGYRQFKSQFLQQVSLQFNSFKNWLKCQ